VPDSQNKFHGLMESLLLLQRFTVETSLLGSSLCKSISIKQF